jgi:hypothetical protein
MSDGTADFATSSDPAEAFFSGGKDFGVYIDSQGVTWHVAQHSTKASAAEVLVDFATGKEIPAGTTKWVAWINTPADANVYQATGSEDHPNVAALNSEEILQAIDEWVKQATGGKPILVRGNQGKGSGLGWLLVAGIAYYVWTDSKRGRRRR